jgi:hypothetical protein
MIGFFTGIVLVFVMAGDAIAGADSMCVNDCMMLNNPKEYCVSRCSYKDKTKQSQLVNLKMQASKGPQANPRCVKICTDEGSSFPFCQRLCSKLPPAREEGTEEPDADDD